MKRLTISGDACTETLALLIMMAWADGRLEDKEKDGVRAAASIFNLTKELRERLDQLLEKPMTVDELLVESLSPRDRAFAFVAARWMAGIDEDVDPKEEELLEKVASAFGIGADRRTELVQVAKDLPPRGDRSWSDELVSLFRAIPARLEGGGEEIEVSFGS
jgi:uncharacterized membrane protein YebE (DUF533 family)